MPFETGKPKTGGRIAGTPNKAAKELREQLRSIIQTTLDELPETLAAMEPADRARLLVAVLPYVMPKLSSIELWAEDKEELPQRSRPDWLSAAAPQVAHN